MSSYLFILCPPYSGSTLLWKLLATSDNVSALPMEGQFLPEVAEAMRATPWNNERPLPWPRIKQVWTSYWDTSKPVLLEKSPPNLIRTRDITANFAPLNFIVMVRNPYAQAEGLMRRNNWTAKRAANFATMCLGRQLENSRELENTLLMTYETLVGDPIEACAKLIDFMPVLEGIDPTASFEVHSIDGTVNRPITDLNTKKIASLARDDIATMTDTFALHEDTLSAWGYNLMTEPF